MDAAIISDRLIDSGPVSPAALKVGTGFSARQFRHTQFQGLMEPVIMVDDYTMTEPTFGAHPHGGLSAVSLLFEDSRGDFLNRDSLGNRLTLGAGDLYWLSAGSGAVHDESPVSEDARIRGLQIFVKLPAALAYRDPASTYVAASRMPAVTAPGVRVRVALGTSNGLEGETGVPNPLTLLDGYLDGGAIFSHGHNVGDTVWVYAVEGELTAHINDNVRRIQGGTALAIRPDTDHITLKAVRNSHFVLISAPPLEEPFVQAGPFAFATSAENEQAAERAKAGHFGVIVP